MIKKCSKTIERAIHHANEQIGETKKLLSVTDAKGLVLLANDGNYFLQHNIFIVLIADIMHRKFLNSEIDGFVYFTVNQVASMPNSPLDWHLWTPGYRQQNDDLLGSFVNRLGDSFLNNFYTKLTGISPTEKIVINNLEKGFDVLKQLKHLPKDIAFKKKSNQ
ncbi:MAG TPA: hypothetical protein PKW69_00330 [Niabella sp.]|nr:hypothetical protein [Niabella sp.]